MTGRDASSPESIQAVLNSSTATTTDLETTQDELSRTVRVVADGEYAVLLSLESNGLFRIICGMNVGTLPGDPDVIIYEADNVRLTSGIPTGADYSLELPSADNTATNTFALTVKK